MPSSTLGISHIIQIALNVHDLERATGFYRDTLGLQFLFSTGAMAFFDCGGVRLMLTRPESPELDHPSSILYFAVPDINRAHHQLIDKNVKFEDSPHLIARMPDHDLWMTHFHDSEQNLLSLMSEVSHKS
ncbi:MAG: VOC family protein [Terriglobales bacterium]|jgi:methylmalonyl-CoA/ethylmalonyl-CoA epimerase|nr:VOC family protein [Terriglobales bacterium]